jgi:glycosyltransferase involved in cell wall biosynthesis
VTFVGSLDGDLKSAAFANAEVFVLPSFSENFGIVVAEALAHGAPVITTKATPWRSLVDHRCGWWIDTGVEPLVTALRAALVLSSAERADRAARGRALVRERFSWGPIAAAMAEFYAWICDEHCRPAVAPPFLAE